MKKLKFALGLPEKILRREKNSTWRINDDKNLQENDTLSLCDTEGKEFAKAKITKVKETTFGALTSNDWEGQGKYSCDEEMYADFSSLYKIQVTQKTTLKIIQFQLI